MKKLLSLFTALPLVAILIFGSLVFAEDGDLVIEGKTIGATYYPDYNEVDQGLTGNNKSVKAFVDAISTDSATLVFRNNSGSATTAYQLSTDETILNNIEIKRRTLIIISDC